MDTVKNLNFQRFGSAQKEKDRKRKEQERRELAERERLMNDPLISAKTRQEEYNQPFFQSFVERQNANSYRD